MNQKYLFGNYPAKLIGMLISSMSQAAIVINILVPAVYTYLLKDDVPIYHLLVWNSLNLLIMYIRTIIKSKIQYYIKLDIQKKINKYLNIYYLVLITSPLLSAVIIYEAIAFDASQLKIISILIVMFAVTSGALFTLGGVFLAFLIFISLNYLIIIATLIYLGGEQNYFFAFVAFALMIVTSVIGRKYFTTLYNAILTQMTFETIFYKSADGMVLIKKNHFIDCNEAIIEMFDFENKEEFLSVDLMRYMDVRQPDGELSIKKMVKMLRLAYRNGINRFEYMHCTKYGKHFWVEIVLTKIYLHGEVLLHGIWRDISAQKELDKVQDESRKKIEELNRSLEKKVAHAIKDLRQKDKILFEQSKLASMGEMIGNIAHQWRQPLSIVSTVATSTLVQKEINTLDDQSLEKNMNIICDNVQYLSQTIDDFRNFIKHDRSKTVFDLCDTLNLFLELNSSWVKKDELNIITDFESNLKFEGYENELIQCFINIFNNARDALNNTNNSSKLVFITLYKMDENILIEFKDNAGGISKEHINHVFEPYFTTKHKSQGTGIGLNMTYQIITSMNGTIDVVNSTYTYNDKEYTGALFTIKFPVYKED